MHRITLLHLSLIPQVGPAVINRIVSAVGLEGLPQLYSWPLVDIEKRLSCTSATAKLIYDGLADKKALDHELRLLEQHQINWATVFDGAYPALLKSIYLPPAILYWHGCLDIVERSVAVIGSRAATGYGKRIIEILVPPLIEHHWTIVSGGAIGADTMAHEVALQTQGKTVAVIGAGLLRPYPSSNKKLFDRIVATGGAVVSPFSLTMVALPGNFPARNRIISGLSQATVVVQAAEQSGALITALYALEQGRDVCAIPGPIDDSLSVGCHKLIKEGAHLVQNADDILAVLGCPLQKGILPKITDMVIQKELHPLANLCREPQSFDDLLGLSGLSFGSLQEQLLELQLAGQLEQDFAGRWCAR